MNKSKEGFRVRSKRNLRNDPNDAYYDQIDKASYDRIVEEKRKKLTLDNIERSSNLNINDNDE